MRDQTLTYALSAGSRGDTFIMTVTGPLTSSTLAAFEREFMVTRPRVLILDLTGVPYMDSAGLGVLMKFYVSAKNNHRELIFAGVSRRVDALLELTQVKPLIRNFATVQDAEASLQA